METQCQHFTITKRNEFLKLLQTFKELLDGTLGTWKTNPVDFELKEDANTILSRSYLVLKAHDVMFKKGVEVFLLLGALKVANDSEWVSPSFTHPKPKSNQVHFLGNFININKQLKQTNIPYAKNK